MVISIGTLFGSDTWVWLGFHPRTGLLSTAPLYAPDVTTALALAGIPQAWTIGVELCFYVIAPFVALLRLRWVAGALIALVAARALILWPLGLAEPYSRALFPLELPFFLLGVLAFRSLALIDRWGISCVTCINIAAIGSATAVAFELFAAGCTLGLASCGWGAGISLDFVSYGMVVATIPFLFRATCDNQIDKVLGDLSYPSYLAHFLVFALLYQASGGLSATGAPWWVLLPVNLGCLIAAAVGMDRLVARPMDSFRVSFGARMRGRGRAMKANSSAADLVAAERK